MKIGTQPRCGKRLCNQILQKPRTRNRKCVEIGKGRGGRVFLGLVIKTSNKKRDNILARIIFTTDSDNFHPEPDFLKKVRSGLRFLLYGYTISKVNLVTKLPLIVTGWLKNLNSREKLFQPSLPFDTFLVANVQAQVLISASILF